MTGSLQEKYSRYYIYLNLKDEFGKRKQKTIDTTLEVKPGNKRKAEKMLRDYIKHYEDMKVNVSPEILFGKYTLEWLNGRKHEVEETTWNGYSYIINNHIKPYFDKKKITLQDLQPSDIQKYYNKKLKEGLSPNTIKRHHANIRKALQDALMQNMIPFNVADRVRLPKVQQKSISYYDKDQIVELFKYTANTPIETCVLLAAFYGLRRSEVVGLKWSAIDFAKDTITICNTKTRLGGIIEKERTKNKSSHRTMPLTKEVKKHLEDLKSIQEDNKQLFGSAYIDNEYVCKMEDGTPISPDYLSRKFTNVIEDNNLPKVTFHGLRHSCASMLLAEGYDVKMVQEFLGHSSIVTTGNIYAHVQYSSKIGMGNTLSKLLL